MRHEAQELKVIVDYSLEFHNITFGDLSKVSVLLSNTSA